MSYITVLCVQGIPILSPLSFMPSPYSTFYNYLLLKELDSKADAKAANRAHQCLNRIRGTPLKTTGVRDSMITEETTAARSFPLL